ncbi:MAG: hypothetical protein SWE60_10380, partial [Thermodesulfobacteriota bacterium]|nr:hypothetical protein [Thermodesulfobacteriota bacterium]
MKGLKLGLSCLCVFLMIAFSGMAYSEVHHVDDCTVCHFGLGGPLEASACEDSGNLMMLREEIETPNSGTRTVVFGGAHSYANGG